MNGENNLGIEKISFANPEEKFETAMKILSIVLLFGVALYLAYSYAVQPVEVCVDKQIDLTQFHDIPIKFSNFPCVENLSFYLADRTPLKFKCNETDSVYVLLENVSKKNNILVFHGDAVVVNTSLDVQDVKTECNISKRWEIWFKR